MKKKAEIKIDSVRSESSIKMQSIFNETFFIFSLAFFVGKKILKQLYSFFNFSKFKLFIQPPIVTFHMTVQKKPTNFLAEIASARKLMKMELKNAWKLLK